jgi:hypothetical protein
LNKIINRIEREIGVPGLAEILSENMEPTDLQSLLLGVYRGQAKRRDPKKVLADYVSNRFLHPSKLDPIVIMEWERSAFEVLPKEFDTIELSPVCPLGVVSSLTPVNQDWVLTTIRNSEVMSDPTNVLALELALRRKKLIASNAKDSTPTNLACSQRVVRAQSFGKSKNLLHHFRLLCLCSAGRDTGNRKFEQDSLASHVGFYINSVRKFLDQETSFKVRIEDLTEDQSLTPRFSNLLDSLEKRYQIETEIKKSSNTYYKTFRFNVFASKNDSSEEIELVDGGDTDWTQKLLSNSKERMVISGLGSERVCHMR